MVPAFAGILFYKLSSLSCGKGCFAQSHVQPDFQNDVFSTGDSLKKLLAVAFAMLLLQLAIPGYFVSGFKQGRVRIGYLTLVCACDYVIFYTHTRTFVGLMSRELLRTKIPVQAFSLENTRTKMG